MATVYRIEDKAHNGPYKQNARRDGLNCGETDKHPFPQSDGLSYISHHEIFCFTSMEALVTWFEDDFPVLQRLGYVVVTFEVPPQNLRVSKSGRQAVAWQSEHSPRTRIPWEEIA